MESGSKSIGRNYESHIVLSHETLNFADTVSIMVSHYRFVGNFNFPIIRQTGVR